MLENILVSPVNKTRLKKLTDEFCEFEGSETYPVIQHIPLLISKDNSLFNTEEIKRLKPQTQNRKYADKKILKNFIRTSVLPTLSKDWRLTDRYKQLAKRVEGGKVLIVGAGNKIGFYKKIFNKSEVITSDVHMQYGADIIFDVHEIPICDHTFQLIIAGQVLEHTLRPWIAAKELERVAAHDGIIQVEVPFAFPYHGAPYDFYRFTYGGLRSLFSHCQVVDYKATEGIFSAVAVINAQALLEISSSKWVRYPMLILGRLFFFWLKYLDLLKSGKHLNDFAMPKGYYMTFFKDGVNRTEADCLNDFELLKKSK